MTENFAQIIAQAIRDSGAGVVTSVPGFGCAHIFDAFRAIGPRDCPVSFHEEVAFSIAHGASIAGLRAATIMKAHGLAKAANAAVDSLAAGTTAGFVVIVPDDKRGKHSDSIFDVAEFLHGLKFPFQTMRPQDGYRRVRDAFAQSEALQLPIALLVDVEELEEPGVYQGVEHRKPLPKYERDVSMRVLCPLLAEYQNNVLTAKLSGVNWREVRKPALPVVPDGLPAAWQPLARLYAPLFAVFREVRGEIVAGDTGVSTLFAFPPYSCIDICAYMGGSIPLAIGACMAGYRDTWAVTGDFSFLAAGHLGLIEAVQRNIALKVLVMYNAKAETTGGQPIPPGMLERVLSGYARYVRHIRDPQNASEIESVLKEAAQAPEMRIIVADYRPPPPDAAERR